MGFLSRIFGLLGNIPWVQIGLFAAVAGACVYFVHTLQVNGEYIIQIKQLKQQVTQISKANDDALNQLKAQYARDTAAAKREKDHAVAIATRTQRELDAIRESVGGSGDGPIRPVLSDVLSWMRSDQSNQQPDTPSNQDNPP